MLGTGAVVLPAMVTLVEFARVEGANGPAEPVEPAVKTGTMGMTVPETVVKLSGATVEVILEAAVMAPAVLEAATGVPADTVAASSGGQLDTKIVVVTVMVRGSAGIGGQQGSHDEIDYRMVLTTAQLAII